MNLRFPHWKKPLFPIVSPLRKFKLKSVKKFKGVFKKAFPKSVHRKRMKCLPRAFASSSRFVFFPYKTSPQFNIFWLSERKELLLFLFFFFASHFVRWKREGPLGVHPLGATILERILLCFLSFFVFFFPNHHHHFLESTGGGCMVEEGVHAAAVCVDGLVQHGGCLQTCTNIILSPQY